MIFFHQLKKFSKKLFVRATLSALVAVFSALAAYYWGYLISDDLVELLGTESVDIILQIIASNMLVIVTFSLATMVAGYTSASQGVTPRAARLLIENQKSENAISIFLGAFIFSIVSLVALSTELYGPGGRFIIFALTCIFIIAIVWTIIRWIEELSKLGRVHETVIKIEKSAAKAFEKDALNPNSFCNTYLEIPELENKIFSKEIGYVQSIDFKRLNKFSEKFDEKIYIMANPGIFVHKNSCLISMEARSDSLRYGDKETEELNQCFVIDDSRSIENDPRYNLIVLSEVASRALSQGVNDPGTAIDSLRSVSKVFHQWIDIRKKRKFEVKYQNLYIKEINIEDCFDDYFRPISRDASKVIEVLTRLLEAIQSLICKDNEDEALSKAVFMYKRYVLERGLQSLIFDEDKILLQKTYDSFCDNKISQN